MALLRKRYSSFGREEKLVGVRALLKADTFLVRAVAFVVCVGVFLLIVQFTHKNPTAESSNKDSVAVSPKK